MQPLAANQLPLQSLRRLKVGVRTEMDTLLRTQCTCSKPCLSCATWSPAPCPVLHAEGELDLNQFQVSPTRRRIATFFRIFLPTTTAACFYYAFKYPDEDQGLRMPPELQYLAAQQTENENTLMNWSATHEARPKYVGVAAGPSLLERAQSVLATTLSASFNPRGLRCSCAQAFLPARE